MRFKPHISTKELCRLYEDEGLSTTQIGKLVGMTSQAVGYRFKMAGFKPEGKPTGRPSNLDVKRILRLYNDELKSVAEIAEVMGCRKGAVRKWLKKNNIPLRPIKRGVRRPAIPVPDLSLLAVGEDIFLPHPKTPGR